VIWLYDHALPPLVDLDIIGTMPGAKGSRQIFGSDPLGNILPGFQLVGEDRQQGIAVENQLRKYLLGERSRSYEVGKESVSQPKSKIKIEWIWQHSRYPLQAPFQFASVHAPPNYPLPQVPLIKGLSANN
jgi:hypothetical protein